MPSTPLQELLESARLANARGEHDALVRPAADALARAEASEHTAAAAEAGLLLAPGLFGQARYTDSVRHGQAARRRWQQAGDDEQACAALRVVVHGLMEAGALAPAMTAAREAFDLAEARGLLGEAVQTMVLVGTLHGRLLQFYDGEVLLMQALSRAREQRSAAYDALATGALVVLLGNAREVHLREGRAEEAAAAARHLERHALHLHRLAHAETHRGRRAVQLGNAGEGLARCGRTDAAAAALAESLAMAREEGLAVVALAALVRTGRLQLAQQQFEAAGHTLAALQEALQSEPHDEAQEDSWELQAALQRHRGEPAEADALEARVADARGVRQRRAAELHAELNLAADARVLPARLHALETRALPPRG